MALSMPHSTCGAISVPVGRKWAVSSPVDCWISISSAAAGDAALRDYHYAFLPAGRVQVHLIPAASPPQFLSGITTDPNGDVSPTPLTFIDSGASGT